MYTALTEVTSSTIVRGPIVVVCARESSRDLNGSQAWEMRITVRDNLVIDPVMLMVPSGEWHETVRDNALRFWLWPLAAALSTLCPEGGLDGLAKRKADWSMRTFGEGRRTKALTAHIRKELEGIEAKPDDLTEPVDVILLAMDLYARAGGTNLLADLRAKQCVNERRKWERPREGEPAEHVREPVILRAKWIECQTGSKAVVIHNGSTFYLNTCGRIKFEGGVMFAGEVIKVGGGHIMTSKMLASDAEARAWCERTVAEWKAGA